MSERTFGVEIECGHPVHNCHQILHAMLQAGFHGQIGNATPRKFYGVGSDGSGIEIRTPILQGDAGFDKLTGIMDFLFDQGCYVSRSDGMHTHVGAEEMLTDKLAVRALARTWYNNQALIARMCSSHRLNAYACMKLQPGVLDTLGDTKRYPAPYSHHRDYRGVHWQKVWGTRNCGVNFKALPEHGTVEFRIHEGCLDAPKAIAWVKFCQALVDYAVSERKEIPRCASKTALLTAVGVTEDVRSKLWHRQPQIPERGRVRRRAKSKT